MATKQQVNSKGKKAHRVKHKIDVEQIWQYNYSNFGENQ